MQDSTPSSIVKLGLVQMSMSDDENSNFSKALDMIGDAKQKEADIVCLPELFLSRYFPQDETSNTSPTSIPDRETEALAQAAKKLEVSIVAGSIYEVDRDERFNTCVVFDARGKMLGKYRKVHIPQDPGFFEQNYFKPGDKFTVFDAGKAKVGPLICFDQWYPEAARINRLLGAEIIVYPTAIGTVDGIDQMEGNWQESWERVQVGHAISNSVIVAAVNRVGKENQMNFWGGSFVCDQFGKILLHAGKEEGVFTAECDLNLGSQIEDGWGFLRNRRPSTYGKITES